jgi:methyltransferase family protein
VADADHTLPLLDAATGCPVCGAADPQPLHVYPNPKRRISSAPELTLTGCRACGVAWSHPLPSPAEVDAWYAGAQGWEQRPGLRAQAAGVEDAEARLARKLEAKRPARERETELLLPLVADLPARPAAEPPAVLDFGCGIGAWLDAFAARGWVTTGIEPGPTARAITARRHRVVEAPPAEPEFDLVIVQHVFEHLHDPLRAARRLAAATRPGGWVFVSVPSFDRLPRHGKLGYVTSGVHLFSYTADGMRRMLGLAGLEVVQRLEGGGWGEGSQGPDAHLKLLARRTGAPAALTGGDPLRPAREALRAWAARRRAELEAAPLPEPPRGLARLSRRRRAAYDSARVKRERVLAERLDMPLLDRRA